MTFELDTSGVVGPMAEPPTWIAWTGLSPFDQGFIRAALESLPRDFMGEPCVRAPHLDADGVTSWVNVGFSSLHPATLARFLKDCTWAQEVATHPFGGWAYNHNEAGGHCFWQDVQAGRLAGRQPLRLSLDADGKIIIEEDAA